MSFPVQRRKETNELLQLPSGCKKTQQRNGKTVIYRVRLLVTTHHNASVRPLGAP